MEGFSSVDHKFSYGQLSWGW